MAKLSRPLPVYVGVRFDAETGEKLRQMAIADGDRSMSSIVRKLVVEEVKKREAQHAKPAE